MAEQAATTGPTDEAKAFRSRKVKDYLKVKGRIDSYTFFNHVGIVPHSGQRTVIDAYQEKIAPSAETADLGLEWDYRYKTFVVACGRRFGKSFISSGLAAEELLIPYSQVLVCSYRLENCKVIFRQVREIIMELGIEIVADRQKELELELINGARLCVASNDNVESRLGNSVSLLIIDEAKLFHRELFETYLEPQLLDYAPYSRTILISSPQEGWLYDYFLRGQSDDPKFAEYWSMSLPTSTNPTISKEYLRKLKERTPPDIWEQEYEGKFISAAGKVVKEFSKARNVFTDDMFPNFWDIVRGNHCLTFHSIDAGYSHYFSGIYFMYVEELDTYFAFGEYNVNKTLTSVHAENFKNYEHSIGLEPQLRYADPAAAQTIADLSEFGLYYNKADKNLRETINCVNTLFYQTSEVTGLPRLMIHHECYELIRQLSQVMWKEDSNRLTRESGSGTSKPFKPDTELKTDWDLFDAFRYGIYTYDNSTGTDIAILSSTTSMDIDPEEIEFENSMMRNGFIRVSSSDDEDDDY